MIVELKAEHPRLNADEIANIVYVRTEGASASTPRAGSLPRRSSP
jgi:hypothetical protein